jgi:hypothetical protein
MPKWLAWVCRRWQRTAAAVNYPTASQEQLDNNTYGIETTSAVFDALLWPDTARIENPDYADGIRFVLTPPREMIADAVSRTLQDRDPVV